MKIIGGKKGIINGKGQNQQCKNGSWPEKWVSFGPRGGAGCGQWSLNTTWNGLPTFRNRLLPHSHSDFWVLLRHWTIRPHRLLALQATLGAGGGAFAPWVARVSAGLDLGLTWVCRPGPSVRVVRFWVVSSFFLNSRLVITLLSS